MSRLITVITSIILVLYWKQDCVNGCSCFPSHPQEQICRADFAFVGKVLTEELIPGQLPDPNNNFAKWKYTLRLIFPIKGSFGDIGSTVEIETPGNGALCGIKLTIGEKYLLSDALKTIDRKV